MNGLSLLRRSTMFIAYVSHDIRAPEERHVSPERRFTDMSLLTEREYE